MSNTSILPQRGKQCNLPPRFVCTMPEIGTVYRCGQPLADHILNDDASCGPGRYGKLYALTEDTVSLDLDGSDNDAARCWSALMAGRTWYVDGQKDQAHQAEWRLRITRETWPLLITFLSVWQIAWNPAISLWLELRAEALNRSLWMGHEVAA